MITIERRLRKLESIHAPPLRKVVLLRGYERKGDTMDGLIAKWHSENPEESEDIFFIVNMIVSPVRQPAVSRHEHH